MDYASKFGGQVSALIASAQAWGQPDRVSAGRKIAWMRWSSIAAFFSLVAASAQGLAAVPQVTASFTSGSIITSIAAQNHTTLVFTLTTQAGDPAASNVNFSEKLPLSLIVATAGFWPFTIWTVASTIWSNVICIGARLSSPGAAVEFMRANVELSKQPMRIVSFRAR